MAGTWELSKLKQLRTGRQVLLTHDLVGQSEQTGLISQATGEPWRVVCREELSLCISCSSGAW